MAINSDLFRRRADRALFLTAAIIFPLLIFGGFYKSYYFSRFFHVAPLANWVIHAHGLVMTLWVVYFTTQILPVRSKNVRLHQTLGMAGIVLATLVVVFGMATAYDAHLTREIAPPGMSAEAFFVFPVFDMLMFVVFFGTAIFYRKRPAEHKTLMLLTAINFLPAALGRMPFVPEDFLILWAFGMPLLFALTALVWH